MQDTMNAELAFTNVAMRLVGLEVRMTLLH